MKVITKDYMVEGRHFYVIASADDGYGAYYGTIPYECVDEHGKLTKRLDGFQMCIGKTIPEALERRSNECKVEKYRAEGHTEAEIMMFVCAGYTKENWNMDQFAKIKEMLG